MSGHMLVVTTWEGVLLALRGWRAGVLLHTPQSAGHPRPHHPENALGQRSAVPRPRSRPWPRRLIMTLMK